MTCELCETTGGELLWRDDRCRVVLVDDPDYPGFCRVIWGRHIKEMTDLAAPERGHLMDVVFAVEDAVRATLSPDKINLASLGNVVPHLHWHVIPRYRSDRHFPNPIWGATTHNTAAASQEDLPGRLRAAIGSRLQPA